LKALEVFQTLRSLSSHWKSYEVLRKKESHIGLQKSPRSTNLMTGPIGSYRIRWSDNFVSDSWWRIHIGFRLSDPTISD